MFFDIYDSVIKNVLRHLKKKDPHKKGHKRKDEKLLFCEPQTEVSHSSLLTTPPLSPNRPSCFHHWALPHSPFVFLLLFVCLFPNFWLTKPTRWRSKRVGYPRIQQKILLGMEEDDVRRVVFWSLSSHAHRQGCNKAGASREGQGLAVAFWQRRSVWWLDHVSWKSTARG